MKRNKNGLIIIIGALLLGAVGFSMRMTATGSQKATIPSPHSVVKEPVAPVSTGSLPTTPVHIETQSVSGRVLDLDGNGVAGATVMAFPGDQSVDRCCMGAPNTPRTRTDREGWFKFENIHLGVDLIAFKGAESLVTASVNTFGPHILTFPQGKLLKGIVRDEEGNSVENARIRAYVRPNSAGALNMGHPLENISEADGSFQIGPVAPETSVILEATHSELRLARATVLVESTSVVEYTTLVLKKGTRLIGSVLTSDGNPLSDVLLTARQRDGVSIQVKSTSEGFFEIGGLGPGEIQISAKLPGFVDSTISVSNTENEVRLELKKTASINGQIIPAKSGLYAVVVDGNSRYRTPIQPDGTFYLSNLSSGKIKILIESEDRNILTSRLVTLNETLASLSISLQ